MPKEVDWVQKLIKECTEAEIGKDEQPATSDLDTFKGVTGSLVTQALKVLEIMEGWCEICGESPELREEYHLVHHYWDYLKRLSQGKV